jgi:hypothetical protein
VQRDDTLFPTIQHPKKRAFLTAFVTCGIRKRAAELAGCDRKMHLIWLRDDPVHATAFEEAQRLCAHLIEDEIVRRGVEGIERGVWHDGEQVGTERHYSDTLLIFAAKGAMPEKYKERRETEHTVSPALLALQREWEALREQPMTPRALEARTEAIEAEITPLQDIQRPDGEDPTFALLDRANGR